MKSSPDPAQGDTRLEVMRERQARQQRESISDYGKRVRALELKYGIRVIRDPRLAGLKELLARKSRFFRSSSGRGAE